MEKGGVMDVRTIYHCHPSAVACALLCLTGILEASHGEGRGLTEREPISRVSVRCCQL